MSNPSVVETVLKVHYGLEYLKLINKQPHIVLMPDMVKDQRKKKVEVAGAGTDERVPTERIHTIGGHAAIGAHALAMLRKRDEGLFEIELIAKTGHSNYRFLQTKLQDEMIDHHHQPVNLSYIITNDIKENESQNRETDLNEGSDGKLQRHVDPIDPDLDMRLCDLEEHPANLLSIIERCTILALLSPKSVIFDELLQHLKKDQISINAPIIVDTSTYGGQMEEKNKEIVRLLTECKDMIGMLSMSEKESAIVAQHVTVSSPKTDGLGAARQINEETQIPILFHTADGVTLLDKKNGTDFTIPSFELPEIDEVDSTLLNGAGDVLNAGYIVARAVKEVLGQVKDEDFEVPSDLILSQQDCVLYGIALVCGRLNSIKHLEEGKYLNKEELLNFVLTHQLKGGSPIPKYTTAMGKVDELFALSTNEENSLLSRVFGAHQLRNVSPKQKEEATEKLFELLNNDNSLIRITALNSLMEMRTDIDIVTKARKTEKEERLVVFVDLDGTLIDSKAAREELMWRAMQKLQLKYQGRVIRREEAVQFYNAIYSQYATYQEAGYPNFRQVWNSPEIYYVYLALLEKMKLYRETYLDEFKKEDFFDRLAKAIGEIEADQESVRRVQMAHLHFDQSRIAPRGDAIYFLQCLKHIVGAKLYAVTEGDDKTQWWKIQRSGLNDIFPIERLISTVYVANPRGDIQRLEDTLCQIEAEVEEITTSISKLTSTINEFEHMIHQASIKGSCDGTLDLLKKRCNQLNKQKKEKEDEEMKTIEELEVGQRIKEMFQKVAHKTANEFYIRAIHSVFTDPQNPRKFIDEMRIGFPRIWRGQPMKLAMVGDRYDNDILPLIRLDSENIITVLVKLGPYGQRYSPEEIEEIEKRPKQVVDSLTAAALYLVNPKTWDEYDTVNRPKGEAFALEHVDLLFKGLESKREVFYAAAIAMVKELEELGDVEQIKRAVEDILPRLGNEAETLAIRLAACKALGEIGDHDIVRDQINNALRKCLTSNIPKLCLAAIDALGLTGTNEDIETLLQSAEQSEYVDRARTASYEIDRREKTRHEQRERRAILEEELHAWFDTMELCRGPRDAKLFELSSNRVDKIISLLERKISKDEKALMNSARQKVTKNKDTCNSA